MTWRFGVKKVHKTRKTTTFHWIVDRIIVTILPEMSAVNLSYSKRWIRDQL